MGIKSVTVVTIDDEGQVALEERPVGTAAFQRLSIDLTAAEDWRGMLDAASREITLLRRQLPADSLILRLALTGSTPLAWRLRRDADLLETELANIAAGLGGCWIEKVEVQCRAAAAVERPAADPLGELTALVEKDVLPSFGFRAEVRGLAEELLHQLPPELRQLMAADEDGLERLAVNAGLAGSAEALAHLHGHGAVEVVD
jgi:exonuclease SbcD